MLLLKLSIYVVLFGLVFHFSTRSYLNPYKLIMVFGKKGAGKTTYLTKVCQKSLLRGKKVYSTVPIAGAVTIEPSQIGYVSFEPDSVILIDEVSLIWDNRDWKSMDKRVVAFFRYQRHARVTVYMFSQSFDVDKKLRDLTDSMWLLSNKLRVFSVARRITKRVTVSHPKVDENGNTGNGSLVEDYAFAPALFLSSWDVTFIPRWRVFFDSYSDDLGLPSVIGSPVMYTTSQYQCFTKKGWRSYVVREKVNNFRSWVKMRFNRHSSRKS